MTRIDFHSNVGNVVLHTCKLTRKAWASGHQIVLFCRNTQTLEALDQALWTFTPLEFIPHVFWPSELADKTPILLSSSLQEPPHTHLQVLINLDLETPPYFSRYERLIEIVPEETQAKECARNRYKFYRDRGYPLHHHNFT
jgi:DNA polymerase III subunit chi